MTALQLFIFRAYRRAMIAAMAKARRGAIQ